MKMIVIPNGCVETTNKPNRFKVNRKVMEKENGELPSKNTCIKVMSGGYPYNGEICHKTHEYIYIQLYL